MTLATEDLVARLRDAGVPAALAATIASDPPPILLVVTLDRPLPLAHRRQLRESLEALFGDRPHPPIAVCESWIHIEGVKLR